jgi:hypothetical protein
VEQTKAQVTKVIVHFGGLCMLVQSDAERPGFYALLPRMKEAHMRHCAMLEVPAEHDPTGKHMLYSLQGQEIDLFGLRSGGTKQKRLEYVADVSKYAGEVPVAKKWFDGTPKGILSARVRLPLGLEVKYNEDEPALLRVDDVGDFTTYGQAHVTIDLGTSQPDLPMPCIVKEPLTPNAKGEIHVRVLNVQIAELYDHSGKKSKHKENDPLPHLDTYYKLLVPHPKSPKMRAGKNVGDEVKHYKDCDCDELPLELRDDKAIRNVDPYNCTLGGGCDDC